VVECGDKRNSRSFRVGRAVTTPAFRLGNAARVTVRDGKLVHGG
jgi:hypothetical protein